MNLSPVSRILQPMSCWGKVHFQGKIMIGKGKKTILVLPVPPLPVRLGLRGWLSSVNKPFLTDPGRYFNTGVRIALRSSPFPEGMGFWYTAMGAGIHQVLNKHLWKGWRLQSIHMTSSSSCPVLSKLILEENKHSFAILSAAELFLHYFLFNPTYPGHIIHFPATNQEN